MEAASQSKITEDLMPRLQAAARRILRMKGIPREEGEDLVQEALLITVQRWEDVINPEAWFVGTLRRRCGLYWRQVKKARERWPTSDQQADGRDSAAVAPGQWAAEARWDLRRLASALSKRERRLLWLRYALGWKWADVADALGVDRNSVGSIGRRALRRLKEAERRRAGGAIRRMRLSDDG